MKNLAARKLKNEQIFFALNNMSEPINIILLCEHKTVRAALKKEIESHHDFYVKMEMGVWGLNEKSHKFINNGVAVLYLPAISENDIENIIHIRDSVTKNIFVIVENNDDETTLRLVNSGVKGLVDQDSKPESLHEKIRKVHSGAIGFSSKNLELICKEKVLKKKGGEVLSKREQEVLKCLARGLSATKTAEELGIALSTVETFRGRIYKKLGLKNVSDITRYAIKEKLIKT